MDWLLILFLAVQAAGVFVLIDLWRNGPPIIPRQNARYVFRIVKRDDRAAYVRMMRRTTAVALRDMNRAMTRLGREMGKAIKPILDFGNALAAALRKD